MTSHAIALAPPPALPTLDHGDGQFLLQAFSSFAETAGSLERTYGLLRAEVVRLHRELQESNGGLARSLNENRAIKQHLDHILEGLPCGVLVVAGGGEISRVNPEGRRLLAWNGAAVPEPAPNHISGMRGELGELLERARTQPGELEQKVSDDPECWLAVRHAAVPGLAPQSSVFILRDISEYKRLERAEQKLLREQALGEMSAVLAHEIRNPLGSLELFAGLLAESELSPESQEWVEQLQAGLRGLAATVNNVLNFHSPPATGRTPTDLGQLLDWAHHFLAPLARRAGVKMNSRHRLTGAVIPADRHRLEQVLLNLLLNAVHALPSGGCLELAGHLTAESRAVTITVRDTGPGIAAENLLKIFEPGFSTRLGSPGMGLAVCRRIVEQHGGTITAQSQLGRGAVFTVALPLTGTDAGHRHHDQDEKDDRDQNKHPEVTV